MATDNSSPNRPEPTTYRENAHSKSPIAPFVSNSAFDGTYTVAADSDPGFDCCKLVRSRQPTAAIAAATGSAIQSVRQDEFRMGYHFTLRVAKMRWSGG